MDLFQAIILSDFLSVITGNIALLWPLNNVSYTSEVIINSPSQDNISGCDMKFTADSPTGIPFSAVQFDGSSGLDIRLDNSEVISEDHSFSGWFKSTQNAASIFHFKSEDPTAPLQELKVVFHSAEIHATRKILYNGGVEKIENVSSTGNSFKNSTWYYISFGIDKGNGKFKVQIDDNIIIDTDLNFANDIAIMLPGILRIGKTFDDSDAPLTGSATCFAFHRNTFNPTSTDSFDQCATSPSTNLHIECPDRNIGYYSHYVGATNLLEQITTLNECSVFRCALSCLRNIQCKFIQYDDSVEGCKMCVILKIGHGNYNPSNGQVYKLDYYE